MQTIKKFKGIFVSALTPFDIDLQVNYSAIKKHIDFLIEEGVNGIVACGVNGEFSSLTLQERKKTIKTIISVTKDRVPVIAGAYSDSYQESIELVNYAKDIGAKAAIISRPYFFKKPTDEGLYNYFSEILEKVNKFPIFLCNIPILTTMELSINMIEELINSHSNIIGIKDLSGQTDVILKYAGTFEELSVLVGSDRMVYNGLNSGCDGAVSAIANILPQYLLNIYDTYKKGDLNKAWIEQETLIGIRSVMRRFPSRAAQKFLLSKITSNSSFVRPPLKNLSEEDKQNLLLILSEHGLPFAQEVIV